MSFWDFNIGDKVLIIRRMVQMIKTDRLELLTNKYAPEILTGVGVGVALTSTITDERRSKNKNRGLV